MNSNKTGQQRIDLNKLSDSHSRRVGNTMRTSLSFSLIFKRRMIGSIDRSSMAEIFRHFHFPRKVIHLVEAYIKHTKMKVKVVSATSRRALDSGRVMPEAIPHGSCRWQVYCTF